MKKYLFLLLLVNIAYAQKNIRITYNVTIQNEDIFKDNADLRKLMDRAIKDAKHLNFVLLCNTDESYFYSKNHLNTDDKLLLNSNLNFAQYRGEIYQRKDSLFCYSNLLGNNIYQKKNAAVEWVLTNETKIIDGFTCMKATSNFKVVSKEKIFNHPVIAWYCPSIPYSFGPNGYSGLPGLILELQVRNVVYGATQIDLNTAETFEIDTKKMKILNEQQYKEALDKINDF